MVAGNSVTLIVHSAAMMEMPYCSHKTRHPNLSQYTHTVSTCLFMLADNKMATHLENGGKVSEMIFDEKVWEIHEKPKNLEK